MWQYSYNLKGLYETPAMPEDSADWTPDRKLVQDHHAAARGAGRTILTEFESKQVLAAYGIPTAATFIATDAAAAVKAAQQIGFPVVLKLYSETITHKTDVGGVQLNLGSAEAVERAFAAIAEIGDGEGRGAAFPGRHRAADGEVEGRLRADHRIEPRSAVRAGAAVRHGRAAGRSLPGSRARRCRR